ncbi:MAG: hypothetical protein HYR90_01195 [Candidatus Andersenbacteria bacterium]|nr:hypothetical protein [Candidatus Andersenbacteria bacterium]MBI3250485.1 hypothetical protein [Candidatus Andersenbacteria bacterium]
MATSKNDQAVELLIEQLKSDRLKKAVFERLFPGHGEAVLALHGRHDLLSQIKYQVSLGPPQSISPCNCINCGFGDV